MPPPLFTFECPDCQSKSEYESVDELPDDITTTSTIVCPSCLTLCDLDLVDNKGKTTKSKFDKSNYRKKIAGITNQLDVSKKLHRIHKYTVPCPHCKHIWEFTGVPIKSVHQCGKCYQYFGFDDVRTTITSSTGSTLSSTKSFEVDFEVSPIYPTSLKYYDINKLADFWRNRQRPKPELEPEEESSSVQPVN